MRVLFYVEPLVERENPVWKKGWVEHFVKEISSALIAEGVIEENIACIVPSALDDIACSILPNSYVVTIDQTELIPRFGSSALAVASGWYLNSAGSLAIANMAELVRTRLGDFVPSLCLTFSPAPFLKLAWPEVKVLHMEYGFISRSPFPETMYFDPRGMFAESILAKYKDELQSWYPPDEAVALLTDLRHKFQASKDNTENPVASLVSQAVKPFESAVLLALQFSNFYAYDANARFTDQYDLLVHTLDSLPSNVAVVVCEHPEHPVLKPETVEYLNRKYPNFVWHPMFRQVYGVSHYLMPFVQGCITVSSSVGLQALLWKKHLAIVGEGHLGGIADTQDVRALPTFLNTPWNENRDRLLCWLLSNYYLPFRYLLDSGQLREYLQSLNGDTPCVIEAARLSSGLTLDKIRLAYDTAWKNRSITPYATAFSIDPDNFVTALFVATEEHGYDEEHCIRQFVSFSNNQEVSVKFLLEGVNSSPVALRFDPANRPCAIWLNSFTLLDGNGAVLWTWCGEESEVRNCLGLELLPHTGKVLAVCYDNDPQFELAIDFSSFADAPGPLVLSVNMARSSLMETAKEVKNVLTGLTISVAEKHIQIASLTQSINERDGQLVQLNQAVADRDDQIASLNQSMAERDEQLASFQRQLNAILNSKSWRLTKPLRHFRRVLMGQSTVSWRGQVSIVARKTWRILPLSTQGKQWLKGVLFTNTPFLFSHTKAYKDWLSFQQSLDMVAQIQLEMENVQSAEQYVPLLHAAPLKDKPAKLICFYLPQFHPIPENNAWWGEGFTEWTNVKPAKPKFEGHYQPHVPGELGYYSLLDPAIQRRQVELAKLYGVGGFCFYFYWFGGKRLLEIPIENYLNDSSLDLPFCLCWANESWSRRWDGHDKEILIAQEHSPADDLAFISYVSRYMRDARYIRIDEKPLLLVYRPSLLPSPKETAQRWRDWCRVNGIGEIYLAYTQSFETIDPAEYGFDAAIEFPPNNSAPPNITDVVKPLDADFDNIVYDWRVFVERSQNYTRPAYQLFRSVCPSWDNTARRKNHSTVFLNSTPALYQQWLENAIADTLNHQQNPDERLIFVNAWNEWAEGAHLEPDAKYGYAWLQAVRDAHSTVAGLRRKVLIVSHDAHPHGAQILSLNLAKHFYNDFGFSVDMIVLGEGELLSEFARFATVHQVNPNKLGQPTVDVLLNRLRANGVSVAIVNTTLSGILIPHLKHHGFSVVSMVHELPGILRSYKLEVHARAIADQADKIVFAAPQVKEGFESFVGSSLPQAVIRPQGLYQRSLLRRGADKSLVRKQVREGLKLPEDAKIMLCAGYADKRKGFDLFVQIGARLMDERNNIYALWVGHLDTRFVEESMAGLPKSLRRRFVFTGLVEEPQPYYLAADVYALTSREDPFPSVVMEALDAMTPVVAFLDCGGFQQLLERDCGLLVPKGDVESFSSAVLELITDCKRADQMSKVGHDIVSREFEFRHYLFDLLAYAGREQPTVSVVLPNYNYARYLPERFDSISAQRIPLYELIVLDDSSTDNSLDVIHDYLHRSDIPFRLETNEINSGSVFEQWRKGLEMARGDYVWIAEADDVCRPEFVESLVSRMQETGAVLGFCDSWQINGDGKRLAESYKEYVSQEVPGAFNQSFEMSGPKFLEKYLGVKNVILNVSGVIFHRKTLIEAMNRLGDELKEWRVAGDWRIYVDLCAAGGSVVYHAAPLNGHRRHNISVTHALDAERHLAEIEKVQNISANSIETDSLAGRQAAYLNVVRRSLLNNRT